MGSLYTFRIKITYLIISSTLFFICDAVVHLNISKPQQCWTFYHSEGDINLGTVLRESLVENLETACWVYPLLMPFLAAVEDVNNDSAILPNTTLGFTVQVFDFYLPRKPSRTHPSVCI